MNPDSPRIIIVSGPPGAGKSTLAKLLAAQSTSPAICLATDDLFASIQAGAIPPWEPAAHHQNRTLMLAIAATANVLAEGGFLVIIEGVIGPWFIDCFLGSSSPIQYIILRPSVGEAIRRAEERPKEFADASVIANLHALFDNLDDLERHVIDSTEMSVAAALAEIARAAIDPQFRYRA